MMKSMKKMLLMAAIAVMMVSLAAPAMADEVQDPQNDPSGTDPVVGDHRDGSSSSIVEEEPAGGVPADDELICMIPEGCDTDEKPYKDPGIRKCDLVPPYCQDNEDSGDDHGHNSGAHPETDDPSPVEEGSKEEEASAPEGMTFGEIAGGITKTAPENDASAPQVVRIPEEAGQIADSDPDIQGGCAFDYEYDESVGACAPSYEDFGFIPIFYGDKPLPDTAGGYVALPGEAAGDVVLGLGGGISAGGAYVEKALDWYGEDGGPIGWGFQGLGSTIGFATETAGTIVSGAGEVVGGVSEGVGDAVDAVGDAAEDVWDEVSSWW
jgi:hypothetical protein